ncbi:MAG: hypothetical protein M1829_005680 [Trizodia sp. TS-e1964]|nr:MAG: hypothetical protein M1829_005680 [Trizodia sp. TS-e1964]
MKFLKHIRSKSKTHGHPEAQVYSASSPRRGGPSRDLTAQLPVPVLETIFTLLCPHVQDESYEALEDSMVDDGCMLCDMRDLAKCVLVRRKWSSVAQHLLYSRIRIDAVHYCALEIELAEKRKRRSFFDRNADPEDAPQQRLKLLCRTLRANGFLAGKVVSLKISYMARETSKIDLARIVSVLPNLRYIDLPEGVFSDDASCRVLKIELQARCPDLRKMKFMGGSESSFASLAQRQSWQALEILELSHLAVEPATLLRVVGFLPTIQIIKITDLPWLSDSVFTPSPGLPFFPPLHELTLDNTPAVTASSLAKFLSRPETREVLSSLTLRATGIPPEHLHRILALAPHLQYLSISEEVRHELPADPPTPILESRSLQTLHFEITSHRSAHSLNPPAESFYRYLTTSLLSSGLPSLTSLYVRDPSYPESLVLAVPPRLPFASNPSAPNPNMFLQQFSVFSKGVDELHWNFTSIFPSEPDTAYRRSSMSSTRPTSIYRASGGLSPQWGIGARQSIVVGNGVSGFLAVPAENGPRQGKREWKPTTGG